ncbi:MAG: right-handed parallel beta-helix repeat-containing protein [bacterium]|nr:right-handed parallel beta-helix repeat-containing protein [bacterium]
MRRAISRGELISGMLAAGVLSACGAKSVPAPGPQAQLCDPVPNDLPWLDQALANPLFASFDKATLLNEYDTSNGVAVLQQPYFNRSGQQQLSGTTISQIPSAGIVITSPGTYALASDIAWSPSAPYSAAITIASGDVTLNLNGHTLSNAGTDASQHVAGVLVKGPLENVVISSGTLKDFTEYGVLAAHACGFQVSGVTVTGLRLNDLALRELTPSGIFASYSQDVTIANCAVKGASIKTDAGAGIQLIRCNQSVVDHCTVQSLVNNAGGMQGFSYLACEQIATSACTADSMQTFYGGNDLTSGHTCIGFLPTLCFGLSFSQCGASNLTGCCDDAHGMSVFGCGSVTIDRFTATNILDGVLQGASFQSGAKATGLEVYSFLGVAITNSTVSSIRALNPQDLQAAGFSAWGAGITFTNCSASNVTVQNDPVGTVVNPDVRGIGFGWAPDPRALFDSGTALGTTYTNCTADSCDVAFDTWNHVLATWSGTSYTNCTTGYLAEPYGTTRTLSCNPCSECPTTTYPVQPHVTPVKNQALGNTYP